MLVSWNGATTSVFLLLDLDVLAVLRLRAKMEPTKSVVMCRILSQCAGLINTGLSPSHCPEVYGTIHIIVVEAVFSKSIVIGSTPHP